MSKKKLKYTGERVTPDQMHDDVINWILHIQRYVFSLNFCTIEPESVILHKLSEGKAKSLQQIYHLLSSNLIFVNRWIPVCRRPLAYLYLFALSLKILLNRI